MAEIYTQKVKTITANGTTRPTIVPTPGKRLHSLLASITTVGGTNTVAGLMLVLTKIVVKVANITKIELGGVELRDYVLLHGAANYDFDGLPNTATQLTIPLAPEWYIDNVADSLAWDPSRLGGDIKVELEATTALSIDCSEKISDDLGAPSSGIITLEVIKPGAGGLSFFVENEIEPRGFLLQMSIYPDSTNARAITPVSLQLGGDKRYAHEEVSDVQNDEYLARFGLAPAAAGRTANIYDLLFVKGDALNRAINLARWGTAKLKIGAAAAMDGTCSILLARLEHVPTR